MLVTTSWVGFTFPLASPKNSSTTFRLPPTSFAVVVAGIGGSYLGPRAVNEALASAFDAYQTTRKNPIVVYAGNNIGEDYLADLFDILKEKEFGIINISKSGTTTETALTFRILKTMLEEKVGKAEAQKRIVAVTDAKRGALCTLATKEGYKKYVIPDDVGGRFSVLTPVGLIAIAVAGNDIKALVRGAQDMEKATGVDVPYADPGQLSAQAPLHVRMVEAALRRV